MNRATYYGYIEEKLHTLATRIETGGKLNMLNLHLHSEDFFLHFFNLLFNYKLVNMNTVVQNAPAIDLIDKANKIVIQVSSTNTKSKIESALKKEIIKDHNDHNFKFISISKSTEKLETLKFENPHSVTFTPTDDIYDIKSILELIKSKAPKELFEIYEFIKLELGGEVDIVKLDTNLAHIINILSEEKWDNANELDEVMSFAIDKKIEYNQLDMAREYIKDYSLYYPRIDAKYAEFDSFGKNKSNSVLAAIRRVYLKMEKSREPQDIFYSVIDSVKKIIIESSNYISIPIDELELCIDVLVVDAFIRCKIFKNPEGYKHAPSR